MKVIILNILGWDNGIRGQYTTVEVEEVEEGEKAEEGKEDLEERTGFLPLGRNRSHHKSASAAQLIAARLQGTEKNRMIRLQQNGLRISPGPIAPQSVMQNHMLQSQKI